MRRSKTLFATALILLTACTKEAPPAVVLPTMVVPQGPTGWIDGQLIARGQLPALKPQPLDASLHKQCGTSAADLSLIVGRDGALQFAVVSIDDAPSSPLPATFAPAFIDQQGCVYRPPVVATRAGQSIKVKNSDPLMHNVRAMQHRKPIFNVAMPLENLILDKPLPTIPGIVQLHCDVHPWMTAWIATFAHNLYAVSDAKGSFRIDGVTVGLHPMTVWHPRLGEKRVEVEVSADAGTNITIGWESSDTRLP